MEPFTLIVVLSVLISGAIFDVKKDYLDKEEKQKQERSVASSED